MLRRTASRGVTLQRGELEGRVPPLRLRGSFDLADLVPLPWPLSWLAGGVRIDLGADVNISVDGTFEVKDHRLVVTREYGRVLVAYQGGPVAGSDSASAGLAVVGGFRLDAQILPTGPASCSGVVGVVGYVTWRGVAYPASASTPFRCD